MVKRTLELGICLISALAVYAQGGPGGGGDGIWQRSAYYGEAQTFDRCLAHQPQSGMYHNHVQPICLRAQLNDNVQVVYSGRTGAIYQEKASGWTHSPILGWAYDGYPIYGPYGYSDPKNASSPIKRVKSSFRLRSMTKRTSLPDWALAFHAGVPQQLSTSQYGPDVSATFPLGRYVEDYDYAAGLGDLDQYNGRFAVTPDFPSGTYAYYVTLNDDGSPAFPYVIGMQYFGSTLPGGMNVNVPASAQDYFANGAYQQAPASSPLFNAWMTKNSQQPAQAISGWDPAAGASTTWPKGAPANARYSGGVTTATPADTQRIRFTNDTVYVGSNDLASYTMGPWFADTDSGGVFQNWPSAQRMQAQIPRNPSAPTAKTNTPGGPVGILVNGVALFNVLDMISYSNSAGQDAGLTNGPSTIHVSAASNEGGPMAPGALATAYALFGAQLSTSVAAADSATSPAALGGATVAIVDSANRSHPATISYASPGQVNYRIPDDVPNGTATVAITAAGRTVRGSINIVDSYPNLFQFNVSGLAAAQVVRVRNGVQTVEPVDRPIDLGPATDQVYLVLYGSGLGKSTAATASIGGTDAAVAYAGPQGVYAGLDQYNVPIPRTLAGKGKFDIVVKAGGRGSNPVNVTVQ